ncbi:MAG: hypothetical protein NVS3B28_14630 [Candidatus Velthaea sp.]
MNQLVKRLLSLLLATVLGLSLCLPAAAGTTGSIVGRVAERAAGGAISGVAVTAVSPSQRAVTTTDAGGAFRFLSLAPDTYVISFEKTAYQTYVIPGVTVFADQSQNLDIPLQRIIATIGRTTSRSVTDLVKPGTVSDVYSVNAAGAEAAGALGGPGGLNTAYSAIASVPGVVVQQGQQGWFQTVNIRGGDIDQVGYELDGIPVNRVYDNAPQTMLSNLGQQELQVYTGGTPASADATGIAGYVNQVVRSGTYPGFTTVNLGIGSPTLYNKASFEFGGATRSRDFTYYLGFSAVNQDYRYFNNQNGANDVRFFYPVSVPSTSNSGSGPGVNGYPSGQGTIFNTFAQGPLLLAGGQSYAIAHTEDRENIANFHFALHHKNSDLRDDVQLLYLTSEQIAKYYSSVNDQGGESVFNAIFGASGPATYGDGHIYTGALYGTPNPSLVTPIFASGTQGGRVLGGPIPDYQRDSNDNGVAITKLQYQHNIDSKSYLRLFGYTMYSNWFINGPVTYNFPFGAEISDYEIPSHTVGYNASYANQLSDKHLLTATASVTRTKLERRYNFSEGGGAPFTAITDGTKCYDTSGAQQSCFGSAPNTFGSLSPVMTLNPNPAALPAGSAERVVGNGFTDKINQVQPTFTSISLTDQFRPSSRLTVNAGARVEVYQNKLASTDQGPARQFWFNSYNNEHCYIAGGYAPQQLTNATDSGCAAAYGPGWKQANLRNEQVGTLTHTVVQPRLGFTYSFNNDSLLRGSYGIYARAPDTSWLQYNLLNPNLASYIGQYFLGYGYNTPVHDLRPDVSYNTDLSLEQHVRGTNLSFKLTPFYRATKDQLQQVPIGAGGLVSGFNVGKQTSSGVELAFRAGDFARDGFSAQLAYTYTRSRLRYSPLPSGANIIDGINQYIQDYNSYTGACAAGTPIANSATCNYANGANAKAAFATADGGTIANPYYAQTAPSPLLDPKGSYTTYAQIPAPFTGENGYETPHVASFILNYKHGPFTITPSATYSSGSFYGSPLAYPGFVPAGCATPTPASCGSSAVTGLPYLLTPDAFTGHFDSIGEFKQPSRLTINLGAGYQLSKVTKVSMTLTGLVDKCFQRGYAWDDNNVCVYSQLPSGGVLLGPTGNFLPRSQTPIQVLYPYAALNNNLNTGFVGTTLPLQASFSVQFKL